MTGFAKRFWLWEVTILVKKVLLVCAVIMFKTKLETNEDVTLTASALPGLCMITLVL